MYCNVSRRNTDDRQSASMEEWYFGELSAHEVHQL
jgi:hypothetical protein